MDPQHMHKPRIITPPEPKQPDQNQPPKPVDEFAAAFKEEAAKP